MTIIMRRNEPQATKSLPIESADRPQRIPVAIQFVGAYTFIPQGQQEIRSDDHLNNRIPDDKHCISSLKIPARRPILLSADQQPADCKATVSTLIVICLQQQMCGQRLLIKGRYAL